MPSPNIYLALWVWGLVAIIAAHFLMTRTRRYYFEPPGLNRWRSGLARFSASNYLPAGVVLMRRALVAYLVFALSFVACLIIYWFRFGAQG